ncbi:MAG: DNA polymerase III subunit alpha [Acidobacteriota bacterium]|nr:DNA polymerase III subunit alpha [Acidobacteriota bacterium]
MDKEFVHLHLHTDYSLLDGAIKIGPLAKRLAELKMSAAAITDHGNLYGSLAFYNKMKAEGVKPIIGIEAYIARGSRLEKGASNLPQGDKATNHIVLLAKNLAGYHNLVKLSSYSYTEGFWRKPRIDKELLAKHSEGLIGLSACISGVPPYLLLRDKFEEAAKETLEFQDIFGKGNYYLEIQEHGLDAQRRVRKPMVELSKKTGVPIVATNDSHYLMPDDVKAHEMLLCIGRGKAYDPKFLTYGQPGFYVKSAEEMWQVFGEEPDLLFRTLEIAEKCDLTFPKTIDQVPVFPVPEDHTIDSYFEKVAWDGFEERLKEIWAPLQASGSLRHPLEKYKDRLAHEIATIKRMGYSGYFLIVWDFIRYAKRKGIPVGPGRGSAAGSLVAYCQKITDVDPIQYDLLFERFLNPERVTMPDIDVDFCVRGRAEVINYVSDLYGRQNVCQIITFGTMASKAVIKDVGRAMGTDVISYAEVEKIAKMIPPPVRGRNVSIEAAIEQNPDLKRAIETDERISDLIDVARKLEGNARHSSVHAAGVVISPKPLHELIPVCTGQNDELITQFVMSDLEKTGMLKMDFLALTTLTIIEDCLKTIEQETGERPDLANISLTDEGALKLFSDGLLNAVFQFESSGMVEICRKLKPESLEDLSALNALYRPGPLDGGMVDDYIERRHGRRKVTYIAPQMKDILENTYGILVYQEQIMQLAQQLAGYSLGEADLMRRAMGKKKKEEMALHEEKFVKGSVERGIPQDKAAKIFSLMAQFADYGFNRSHSFAYAYLAYQTAYLKAHYPTHFYAAVLSNELSNADKLSRYIAEMKTFGISLLAPDVNTSNEGFTPVGKAIRFGLAAIKGLGSSAVQLILAARREGGNFNSLFDFAERVDQRAVNKRVLESLVKSGAFEFYSTNRAAMLATLDKAIESGAKAQRDKLSGQTDLFASLMAVEESSNAEPPLPNVKPWTRKELLAYEKEALGFYASGHPLEDYADSIRSMAKADSGNIAELPHGEIVSMGGIVLDTAVKTTKKGDRFALFRLEDQFGSIKIVCWPEQFNKYKTLIQNDEALLVKGKLELNDESDASIIVQEIIQLESAKAKAAKGVLVKMKEASTVTSKLQKLNDLASVNPGTALLFFDIVTENGMIVRLRPNQFFRINATNDLIAGIEKIDPGWQVELMMNEFQAES